MNATEQVASELTGLIEAPSFRVRLSAGLGGPEG